MQCPKCQFEQSDGTLDCQRCGVIFAKFYSSKKQQKYDDESATGLASHDCHPLISLLFITPETNYMAFWGRVLVLLLLLVWGGTFIFGSIEGNDAGQSFMHLINLPFHEAGHLIFSPFGAFITSLGGSLGQLLMPLICLGVLLVQTRDAFGASVCLWWFGQNFIDLAPYINDARSGTLPLLGGNFGHSSPYGFHDWNYLLTESGLRHYDHLLARMAMGVGTLCIVLSLIWGGGVLFRQYQQLRDV